MHLPPLSLSAGIHSRSRVLPVSFCSGVTWTGEKSIIRETDGSPAGHRSISARPGAASVAGDDRSNNGARSARRSTILQENIDQRLRRITNCLIVPLIGQNGT